MKIEDHFVDILNAALLKKGFEKPYTAEVSLGLKPDTLRNILRDKKSGDPNPRPRIDTAKEICDALGLEFYIGPPRGVPPSAPDFSRFSSDRTVPQRGLAKCGLEGWANGVVNDAPLPAPADLSDPDAFYVRAAGQSMQPEGINNGDLVLVSPALAPQIGDRVFLIDHQDRSAIKRLINIDEKWIYLHGWLPGQVGKQQGYKDHRAPDSLKQLAPIIAVYRKNGDQMALIPDPKAPQKPALIPIAGGDLGFSPEWLRQAGIDPTRAALINVPDAAMAPTLTKGAMALINHTRQTPIGKRAYAIEIDGKTTIRRLEMVGDHIVLLADNPAVQTQILTPSAVKIIGEVVWAGGKL